MKSLTFLLFVVITLSACSSQAADQPRPEDERARLNRVENQNKALEAYRTYLKTRYPDWKLIGDDINYDRIQRAQETTFTAHINYDGIDKYVVVTVRQFNQPDNGAQYWKAYEPSAIDRLENLGQGAKQ